MSVRASRRLFATIAVASLATGAGCNKRVQAPARSEVRPAARDAVAPATPTEAARTVALDAAHEDARSQAVLTIRVINAGTTPMQVLLNEDTNEMIHTRKLLAQRRPDASGPSAVGDLVKFFPVGEMPLCTQSDGGAGYGGLGQPEPRTLAPNEALEFTWDGRQRVETNVPGRGVCAQIVEPEPARYRFEFDQPYHPPNCTRPVITLPLAPDAPRVVEIRCTPRQSSPEGQRGAEP